MGISQLFLSMPGSYRFHRTISGAGTIEGTATFTKIAENELKYREEGSFFHQNGQVYNIHRTYLYCCQNEVISVLFEDRKPFQKLAFSHTTYPLVATADHLCSCDLYSAVYTFFADQRFDLCYTVKGPKKDYTILTHFFRR